MRTTFLIETQEEGLVGCPLSSFLTQKFPNRGVAIMIAGSPDEASVGFTWLSGTNRRAVVIIETDAAKAELLRVVLLALQHEIPAIVCTSDGAAETLATIAALLNVNGDTKVIDAENFSAAQTLAAKLM